MSPRRGAVRTSERRSPGRNKKGARGRARSRRSGGRDATPAAELVDRPGDDPSPHAVELSGAARRSRAAARPSTSVSSSTDSALYSLSCIAMKLAEYGISTLTAAGPSSNPANQTSARPRSAASTDASSSANAGRPFRGATERAALPRSRGGPRSPGADLAQGGRLDRVEFARPSGSFALNVPAIRYKQVYRNVEGSRRDAL